MDKCDLKMITIDENERIPKYAVVAYFQVLSKHLPADTARTKNLNQDSKERVEIRAGCLQNARLQR
jgi:hypothetical protein